MLVLGLVHLLPESADLRHRDRYPRHDKRLKIHGTPWQFSETSAKPGIAPEPGAHAPLVLAPRIAGADDRKTLRFVQNGNLTIALALVPGDGLSSCYLKKPTPTTVT